ncbi:MAG: hypothetical protein ACOCQD_02325 [archaeon]
MLHNTVYLKPDTGSCEPDDFFVMESELPNKKEKMIQAICDYLGVKKGEVFKITDGSWTSSSWKRKITDDGMLYKGHDGKWKIDYDLVDLIRGEYKIVKLLNLTETEQKLIEVLDESDYIHVRKGIDELVAWRRDETFCSFKIELDEKLKFDNLEDWRMYDIEELLEE